MEFIIDFSLILIKTIISSLASPTKVYYYSDTGNSLFHLGGVDFGGENFVQATLTGASAPAGFGTDFPSAVAISSRPDDWSLVG